VPDKEKNKENQLGKGFDRIVFFYDAMTQIISFNQINKSQLAFLSHLSTQSTCLIFGGGTGYFLQKLVEKNKTIHVTYVDASLKMIKFAKKRIQKNVPDALHRVTFMCEDVQQFKFDSYDIIVCNYFLDLFDDAYVKLLVERFKQHLNNDGLLYITDFSIPVKGIMQWSTKAGLKILYWFFTCTTGLSANKLPNIESIVLQQKFVLQQSATFFKGVLKCSLYKQSC
jgi:ubiquinone/menaquinone biosynthesis C-methylase UbiE